MSITKIHHNISHVYHMNIKKHHRTSHVLYVNIIFILREDPRTPYYYVIITKHIRKHHMCAM